MLGRWTTLGRGYLEFSSRLGSALPPGVRIPIDVRGPLRSSRAGREVEPERYVRVTGVVRNSHRPGAGALLSRARSTLRAWRATARSSTSVVRCSPPDGKTDLARVACNW